MKNKLLLLLFLLATQFSNASEDLYSRVKIWFDNKHESELAKLGIDLTEGDYRKNVWFVSDFSEKEIARMQQAGFRTEVLINDVKEFYRNRSESNKRIVQQAISCAPNTPDYPVPSNFYLGDMGGFFTYSQLLEILDSMVSLYPNLITIKQSIDVTASIEGNQIFYVKISDNPNVDENEPELLYSALHHAREPESLSQLIYYMWYLLENYSSDTNIKGLVDNTEMFFIPCINPDGYLFNESTDPFGGGMWRKNRRDNLDGEFGVDLNRNYGYQWGYDTIGSAIATNRETYRGTSAFSEPETQAVRNFTNTRNFRLAFNYHSYGNHNIIPFGYIPNFYSPDSIQYDFYGEAVTRYNNYHVGTSNQTVAYQVNGSSDDWMYGEQLSKPKVFAMTPEVGTNDDGFWPMPNRIIDLCKENVYANLTLAKLAGHYGRLSSVVPRYTSQLTNQCHFTFQQLGFDTAGSYTVSIIPVSANIASVGSPFIFSNPTFLGTISDSISYTLNPAISPADQITFLISIDNGMYVETDTLTLLYGSPVTLLDDDGTNAANWNTASSSWGTTTEDFVSPPSSITDSPFSLYQPNVSNPMELISPLSLSGILDARLTFWAKWETEAQYDYAQVLASSDNGMSWTALCGKYTTIGSASQAPGEPVYDGSRLDWVSEEINLNNYIGQSILLKFVITSDQFQEFDGFYFDDLKVEVIPDNTGITTGASSIFVSQSVPNPSADFADVNYSNTSPGTILFVYNTFGQIVWKTHLLNSSGRIQIPVNKFSSGMYSYFIQLPDGSVSKAMKMVVR